MNIGEIKRILYKMVLSNYIWPMLCFANDLMGSLGVHVHDYMIIDVFVSAYLVYGDSDIVVVFKLVLIELLVLK